MARTKVRREDVAEQVVGPPETADYRPSWGGLPSWFGTSGGAGIGWLQFTLQQVEPMLDDPIVALGTSIIETPVIRHEGQWQVLADSPEVQQFVDRLYRTYWRQSIREVLGCVKYGYAACEALYDWNSQGQLDFVGTKHLHSLDVKAGLDRTTGMLGGVIIDAHAGGSYSYPIQVGRGAKPLPRELMGADGPRPAKGIWSYYGSEDNGHYGRSRYKSAFPSWREKNGVDGTLDIIRMWYYKNAYSGLIIRYPEKQMNISGRGTIAARDMARQIAETLKTGGVAAIPSTKDPKTGVDLWSVEWPKMNGSAEGLLDYKRVNDEDILRGLLIPDDVITGSGGYSGRKVSEDAFYTMEEDLLHRCVWPFDSQVVRPLVWYNFGEGDKYQVVWQPMLPARQQLDAQQQNGAAGLRQGGGNPAAGGGTGLAQALLGGSPAMPPGGDQGQAQAPENRAAQVGLSLSRRFSSERDFGTGLEKIATYNRVGKTSSGGLAHEGDPEHEEDAARQAYGRALVKTFGEPRGHIYLTVYGRGGNAPFSRAVGRRHFVGDDQGNITVHEVPHSDDKSSFERDSAEADRLHEEAVKKGHIFANFGAPEQDWRPNEMTPEDYYAMSVQKQILGRRFSLSPVLGRVRMGEGDFPHPDADKARAFHGWMDRRGDYHPTGDEIHADWAHRHLGKLGMAGDDPFESLLKLKQKGWVRVNSQSGRQAINAYSLSTPGVKDAIAFHLMKLPKDHPVTMQIDTHPGFHADTAGEALKQVLDFEPQYAMSLKKKPVPRKKA